MALVSALHEWRCYLEGNPAQIFTDHQSLEKLMTQPKLNGRQARWLELIWHYQHSIKYKEGVANLADPFSRRPDYLHLLHVHRKGLRGRRPEGVRVQAGDLPKARDANLHLLESTVGVDGIREALVTGYQNDPYYATGAKRHRAVKQVGGVWYFRHRVAIPNDLELRQQILRECHDTLCAGHQGWSRTLEAVAKVFWWPRLSAWVRRYVAACASCQAQKPRSAAVPGLLQPLPVPGARWESVSMDLMVSLPKSEAGHDAVVVYVDRLSKRVHLTACHTAITAPQLARLFVRDVFRLHGMPKTIVCDRDPKFVSEFWTTLFSVLGTTLNISTAYHPQTDGQTERMNMQLEQVLRHFLNGRHSNWEDLLPVAEFVMNSYTSATTGFTPFFLDTGMVPRTPIALAAEAVAPEGVPAITEGVLAEWREGLAAAQVAMKLAQDRYAAQADLSRVDMTLSVGQKVWLSSENVDLAGSPTAKFRPRWLGPFPVKRVVSKVACELELPSTMRRMHPVFHVSLLKPHIEDPIHPAPDPPAPVLNDEGEAEYYVEEIIGHRVRKYGKGQPRLELLVRWRGYGPEEDQYLPLVEVEETEAYDRYEQEMLRLKGPTGWPPALVVSAPKSHVHGRRQAGR